jgi:hypothetical protein
MGMLLDTHTFCRILLRVMTPPPLFCDVRTVARVRARRQRVERWAGPYAQHIVREGLIGGRLPVARGKRWIKRWGTTV